MLVLQDNESSIKFPCILERTEHYSEQNTIKHVLFSKWNKKKVFR